VLNYTDSLKRDLGNFLEGDEKNASVGGGYPPPTLVRLAALKAQDDPTGRLSRAMAMG